MSASIYASDPDAAPDSEFEPGELHHLVAGNRGRMLDARRTPIEITGVRLEIGAFELEVCAFEDAGARWLLALEELGRFQFAKGAQRAPARAVTDLRDAQARFDRELTIAPAPDACRQTRERIASERRRVRTILAGRKATTPVELSECIARRRGEPGLCALLQEVLDERGVGEIERDFTETFVSHPRSGEIVKGHAIVLAELGLAPYRGKVVRDPDTFAEPQSRARRAEHLLIRLAFVWELFSTLGFESVTLYRGAAVDGALSAPTPSSFVSTTFSEAVAREHFEGGSATQNALLWRGRVPVQRLLMTFLETEAMNGRFAEAEAVLIGGPDPMQTP